MISMNQVRTPSFALKVIERGWVIDTSRGKRPVIGSVSREESQFLFDCILKQDCKTVVETGIARGISSLAIAEALSHTGGKLYGFDPCQTSEHGNAAVETIREFGLSNHFELKELGSEVALPQLASEGFKCDMLFIDGIHRFLERSMDFYYADRMLRIGGIVAFHDLWLPSMKKVLKMVRTFGTYKMIETPTTRPALKTKLRLLAGAVLKMRPYCLWWPNGFSNLLVLQKVSEFDESVLWYRRF
jgi:predicted O-methyltransferase YrrM